MLHIGTPICQGKDLTLTSQQLLTDELDLKVFSDRLKWARKSAGLSQAEVCSVIGISQPSLSDLENGKSQRSFHTAELAKLYNVDYNWLHSGEGDPRPHDSSSIQSRFEKLKPEQQRLVRDLIDSFLFG